MNKKYYHITDVKNKTSILKNGLRANEEGFIFLFENVSTINRDTNIQNTVSDMIAANQLSLEEYAMFEIDSKGINENLLKDEVAEFSAKNQFIAKQENIAPQFINLFGIYKTEYTPFFAFPIPN